MNRKGGWKQLLSFKLLKNQIILWFVTVIVLLLSTVAGFTVLTLRPYLYDTHISHLQKTAELLSWELANQREKLQSYSVNILADATVQSFLLGRLEDTSDISNRLRLLMMRYTEYDRSIQGLYLVDGEQNLYGNNVTRSVSAFVDRTLDAAYHSSGGALWSTDYPGETVVMYRVIHDTTLDLNHKIGALYMLVDKRSFTDVCARFLDSGLNYRLENDAGTLVLGDAPPAPEQANRFFTCTAAAEGWTLSAWMDRDEVYAPANSILNLVMYCLIATLLVGVGLTVFISGRLTKPLRELRHAMVRAGGGDLDANVSVRREDEIARLARTYNRMLSDTKEFIRQNEENQRRQKALELKTLQYQINPHFLYNTLDSIYMMARKSGNEEIGELVVSLSTLFRLSLAHGQDVVTLEHELKYVSCYLQIQRIRFPSEFSWRIDAPDELLSCRVLKFMLQPLVENSLNHGLRGSPDGGGLVVSARREKSDLVLRVSDNGSGMTVQQLESLVAHINRTDIEESKDPFAGGVGVRNVHQRLLLCYGRGLDIQSDWEEGTVVTIRIPYEQTQQNREESQ